MFYGSGELSEISPGMAETVQSRVSDIGHSVYQMQTMVFISCDEKTASINQIISQCIQTSVTYVKK